MRVWVTAALIGVGVAASFFYVRFDECRDWQTDYKRFLFTDIMKISSPIHYTPDDIEEVIGVRPPSCELPGRTLSKEDVERFRREGVGPDYFVDRA